MIDRVPVVPHLTIASLSLSSAFEICPHACNFGKASQYCLAFANSFVMIMR